MLTLPAGPRWGRGAGAGGYKLQETCPEFEDRRSGARAEVPRGGNPMTKSTLLPLYLGALKREAPQALSNLRALPPSLFRRVPNSSCTRSTGLGTRLCSGP